MHSQIKVTFKPCLTYKFYINQNQTIMKKNTGFALIFFIFILGATMGFFGNKIFFAPYSGAKNITQQITQLKYLGNTEMLSYEYMEIVPLENAYQKVQLLLFVPVQVKGEIDFSKMQINVEKKKLTISLPAPSIHAAEIDYNRIVNYDIYTKLGLPNFLKESYNETFKQITDAIAKVKSGVQQKAKEYQIEEKTKKQAVLFLQNYCQFSGYEVAIN